MLLAARVDARKAARNYLAREIVPRISLAEEGWSFGRILRYFAFAS